MTFTGHTVCTSGESGRCLIHCHIHSLVVLMVDMVGVQGCSDYILGGCLHIRGINADLAYSYNDKAVFTVNLKHQQLYTT